MADSYVVTSSVEALDTTDVTNPVRVRQVTFKTAKDGMVGTVKVPLDNFTPQAVDKAITDYVAQIDAVHSL